MFMVCQPPEGHTTAAKAEVSIAERGHGGGWQRFFNRMIIYISVNNACKFGIKTLTINRILLQNGQRKGINFPYTVVSNNRNPYKDQGTFFIIQIWPASLNLRQMV
jgi:hypothetical protein